MTRLTLATRRSALALAQSRAFARALVEASPGLTVGELEVVTSGDKITDRPLQEVGGKGLFVKELEEALLDGRAHFAVHSYKDVPAVIPDGLVITCVPRREDPRDVFITRTGATLAELPAGSRVGTSSLRRAAAIGLARPDLVIVPLRGNVDTRLRKLDEGHVDAIVLALAGLRRLGLERRATEILDPAVMLPAIGQGALGIECREVDAETQSALAPLDDPETSVRVAAERGVMVALGADCRTPVAAHAVRTDEGLWIRAMIAEADGTRPRMGERRVAWPSVAAEATRVGLDLGQELLRA
ncbi:hydroxymethylbilane synthase [Polyangium jinanense]|uniref:Porphobilinogen deaminase n=1 Tax=Polyangium jinanense TaxID=2829994 RepID=A0A9X4AVB9_9BACT|nr:hydroxymethylbilane synthase [Polyangium jinanense]MDC3959565.1 hydroxymethylbilane synthase [Polyangium jinanense]MDC3986164.1 hydroxymethylbilane synthase [Polyangium jinanense]